MSYYTIPQDISETNKNPIPPSQNQDYPTTKINPKYLSDPEKIITKKSNDFIQTFPEKKFRENLMLNEPPNFFNPFLENTGNNYANYNPFYTNDRYKISLNTNGYLIQRFIKANFSGRGIPQFFSKEEYAYFYRLGNFQIFLSFSTLFYLFQFYKTKKNPFLGLCLFNTVGFMLSSRQIRFVIYNSYLRNFNGYSDEQIDYIISCNQKKEIKN